jgi:tRNA(adenine34) deaminase
MSRAHAAWLHRHHRDQITAGVMADRCGKLLTDFFAAQRALGKK